MIRHTSDEIATWPSIESLRPQEGERQARAHREMEALFATRTRDEWVPVLAPLDACCEPVLDLDEVARHPQIAARHLIDERATGVEVRPAVVMREDWRRLDPPGLGEHTAEILGEVGVEASRLEDLRKSGVV